MDGFTFSQSMINSIGVAIVGATLSFAVAYFWYAKNIAVKKADAIAAGHELVLARLAELEAKERVSAQVTTPFVTAFQAFLIQKLTHANKPEMDALLLKIGPPDILTPDDRARLMIMLRERTRDRGEFITESERDAARILPYVMKMANEEQENLKKIDGTQDMKLATIVSVVSASVDATAKPEIKDE